MLTIGETSNKYRVLRQLVEVNDKLPNANNLTRQRVHINLHGNLVVHLIVRNHLNLR